MLLIFYWVTCIKNTCNNAYDIGDIYMTTEQTQQEVIFTKRELWGNQAPNLNFEYDEDQLLKLALKKGFVTKVGEDQYKVNLDY